MGNIVLRKVNKSFGATQVIPGIDLNIDDGEFVVFVGPSGCGKSTLLRLIAGLEDTTSGTIEIDGQNRHVLSYLGDFLFSPQRARTPVKALSGGERQSLAMARALMMEPSVLLLDEPSAGLSPVRQDETFIRTRRINKTGVCVVMVEQNARRCLQICDRGYVLDQGRDAHTGTGRELANDPKVIELYLGTLAKDVDESREDLKK